MVIPPEHDRAFWLIWLTFINACAASSAPPERWWVMLVAIGMWPTIAALGDLAEHYRGWKAHRKKIDEAFHGG